MGGNFVCCLIIIVKFIGLGRACIKVGGDFEVIIWGWRQAKTGWNHFYGGSLPLETPCKNFNLAIGGGAKLDEWFKNEERKVYI